jgi:hypothetical protein
MHIRISIYRNREIKWKGGARGSTYRVLDVRAKLLVLERQQGRDLPATGGDGCRANAGRLFFGDTVENQFEAV